MAAQAPVGEVVPVPVREDAAVTFLTSLVPPTPAERTRAFAALLRVLSTRGAQ